MRWYLSLIKPDHLPASLTDQLSRYERFLAPDEHRKLETELLQPLAPAIRLNPLKIDPSQAILDLCQRYNWRASPLPFCPTGWQIENARPSQTIEYRMGNYFIQDAASMLPVELFDFKIKSPCILDLAASPGGKTTHLVSRNFDQGLIIANDASTTRLAGLRSVINSWGAINTATCNFYGEKFGAWFPGTFDYVLVDAPCSMENLRIETGHPPREISTRERAGLAHRQLNLLSSAFLATKAGGQVVYATCTLSPEEDEAVVDRLLHLYPGQVSIQEVSRVLGKPASGLGSFNGRTFDPEVTHSVRIWPHTFKTSGFFCALIKKIGGEPAFSQLPFRHPSQHSLPVPLSRKEQSSLTHLLSDRYGFDLQVLIEKQELSLWKRAAMILALPELYFRTFDQLPYFSLGMILGEMSPKDYSPSHEFSARFGSCFEKGRYQLSEDLIAPWVTGEDVPRQSSSGDSPPGSTVIVFDPSGRNLGRGRLFAKRLKNLQKRRPGY
jgi:16S rRNA (cytosine1407-C5)-methyltransferase